MEIHTQGIIEVAISVHSCVMVRAGKKADHVKKRMSNDRSQTAPIADFDGLLKFVSDHHLEDVFHYQSKKGTYHLRSGDPVPKRDVRSDDERGQRSWRD